MKVGDYTIGIGALIALGVLICVLVLFIADEELTRDWILALIGALAVARIVP